MTAHAELVRRESNRDRALRLLQEKRRVTNVELLEVAGMRFGGRLHELRREGHEIETIPSDGGLVHYEYRGFHPPIEGWLF